MRDAQKPSHNLNGRASQPAATPSNIYPVLSRMTRTRPAPVPAAIADVDILWWSSSTHCNTGAHCLPSPPPYGISKEKRQNLSTPRGSSRLMMDAVESFS